MGEFFLPRRLVALAAAYVIALQVLQLPLSVAAGSAFDFSLCTAATLADGSPAPGGRDDTGSGAFACHSACRPQPANPARTARGLTDPFLIDITSFIAQTAPPRSALHRQESER
jgi:hypothetical protein